MTRIQRERLRERGLDDNMLEVLEAAENAFGVDAEAILSDRHDRDLVDARSAVYAALVQVLEYRVKELTELFNRHRCSILYHHLNGRLPDLMATSPRFRLQVLEVAAVAEKIKARRRAAELRLARTMKRSPEALAICG